MTNQLVLDNLCYLDSRSSNYYNWDDEGEAPIGRNPNCACDACFYGKDALALEILRLEGIILELKEKTDVLYKECY